MEKFLALVFLAIVLACAGYGAYWGIRWGNRIRRSAKDYLNS